MNIPIDDVIHLLHSANHGALATLSERATGYPYATVLPFVLDEQHRPVFLISLLAEHTKNLLSNPRASLVVSEESQANVLAGARVSLIGDVVPWNAEQRFVARYLRYQPDGERYLALGDFAFFRMTIKHVRAIAGFGEMGWIEPEHWSQIATMSLEAEAESIKGMQALFSDNFYMLGIDPYGADCVRAGVRERHRFENTPLSDEALKHALRAFG